MMDKPTDTGEDVSLARLLLPEVVAALGGAVRAWTVLYAIVWRTITTEGPFFWEQSEEQLKESEAAFHAEYQQATEDDREHMQEMCVAAANSMNELLGKKTVAPKRDRKPIVFAAISGADIDKLVRINQIDFGWPHSHILNSVSSCKDIYSDLSPTSLVIFSGKLD